VYVYAITKESHPLDLGDTKGVGDPPGELRAVRGASLCAVVSECPDDLSVARRDLQAHRDVQERLWADGPTLPLSFGFVAADDAAVVGVLEEQAQLFAQRLDELAGRAEFNVKGVLDENTVVRAILEQNAQARELNELTRTGGGTYEDRLALGELVSREVQGRQDALAEDVLAALRPLAEAEKVAPPSQQYFVSASFLLAEDRAEEFDRAGQELAERYGEGVELRLRGPLPPYSFV
jgi:hypothetical protein